MNLHLHNLQKALTKYFQEYINSIPDLDPSEIEFFIIKKLKSIYGKDFNTKFDLKFSLIVKVKGEDVTIKFIPKKL